MFPVGVVFVDFGIWKSNYSDSISLAAEDERNSIKLIIAHVGELLAARGLASLALSHASHALIQDMQ